MLLFKVGDFWPHACLTSSNALKSGPKHAIISIRLEWKKSEVRAFVAVLEL